MNITALRIRIFGDPALRRRSVPVRKVTARYKEVLSRMSGLMYENSGIGLAAPQVGVNECMIVADIGGGLYKLVNPKIVKREGKQVLEEGCLSVPGVCIKVKRANSVVVEALDESGKHVTVEAEGLLACVFQHEIDHLRGKLIIDYAGALNKLRIAGKLKRLKKISQNELSESQSKSCKLQL